MSTPQLENGYFPIANELSEAMYRTDFGKTQQKILWLFFRYTYGYHRKKFKMSGGFVANETGIDRSVAGHELGKLVKNNVLKVVGGTKELGYEYELNKDYKTWKIKQHSVVKNTTPAWKKTPHSCGKNPHTYKYNTNINSNINNNSKVLHNGGYDEI